MVGCGLIYMHALLHKTLKTLQQFILLLLQCILALFRLSTIFTSTTVVHVINLLLTFELSYAPQSAIQLKIMIN